MTTFLRWLTWRLWCPGPWQDYPPQEAGTYWMRTKMGLHWSTPVKAESVQLVGGVRQMDILSKPKANRRWTTWRVT